jgi:O-glycosyl hydrolase
MNPRILFFPILLASLSAHAVQQATFNSAGSLASLITDGREIAVHTELSLHFTGGPVVNVQPADQRANTTRRGTELAWTGLTTFANGQQASYEIEWTESDEEVAIAATVVPGGPGDSGPRSRAPLLAESLDFVIDLSRDVFAGWRIGKGGAELPGEAKPANPVFHHETTGGLEFADPQGNWRLALALDRERAISIEDVWQQHWQGDRRVFRVRVRLAPGPLAAGDAVKFGATFKLTGRATAAPARIAVDTAERLFRLDGFGGNYCFGTGTPVADFTLDGLRHAWSRFEFKGMLWDRERENPGPALVRDFELMQRVDRMGIPWVLSLWRLPERYYADPNQKTPGTFNRQIAADRWPEFLDLLGSFILHLKEHYGAEPDFYSFNEPDLGVDIGFTGETHRDMVKRIGAHLESLGLKTKLLLGDTANPRDTHRYVLPTAADADAMRYVGAVSFHSWFGGSPAQYRAWRDVARWLDVPLVVGEAGVDPGAYRNRTFDSYAYGLGEMRQYQELLRDAQPQTLLFWEYTEDYGLAFPDAGGQVVPTSRFWLMKHFANLTPMHSEGVASTSDQPDVLVSAFVKDGAIAVHILNTGPAREATVAGLPAGRWRSVATTETVDWAEAAIADIAAPLALPARSFVTLVREE